MASPIPIASFGNNSQVAQDIRSKLLPEYDITHICLTLDAAQSELPALFAGALETAPSSGLGSNANLPPTQRKIPQALIFGGGVPEEQVKSITEAVLAKAPSAKPIHITREQIVNAGGSGPNPDIIARVLKAKLDEEVGNGNGGSDDSE
ncbi:hypothetical protein QBC37DRAFT_180784 [Rhypophila decipiens]|uniref:Uncharacterized protein n=1 Tax=Rhypophila decipiens TaxID=261697 RepID=A0AAN6Y5T3_9PEZI|nr:hypothetical protein QBC37DRAFT_180784 [Rhypophila decipiens]